MGRRAISGVLSFVLALFVGGLASAQQEQVKAAAAASARVFKFQTIEYVAKEPGLSTSTVPVAINDSGVAVGTIIHAGTDRSPGACWNNGCGNEMFVWENGKLQLLTISRLVYRSSRGHHYTKPWAVRASSCVRSRR